MGGSWAENSDVMLCETVSTTFLWLFTFFTLCLFGMIWMGCGSLGNADDNKKAYKPILAIVFLYFVVISPFGESTREKYTTPSERYVRTATLMVCVLVVCLHAAHMLYIYLDDRCGAIKERLNRHAMQDEVDLKVAISNKLCVLVQNAMEIHRVQDDQKIVQSYFGHALHIYSKWHKTERIGGLTWSWKSMLNKNMYRQEGVWCKCLSRFTCSF